MRRAIQRGESCARESKSTKTHLNVVNLQNERQLARRVAVKLQDLGASFTKATASSRVDGAVCCLVSKAESLS